MNSRGAIARFDRNAIEIRVIDVQECPKADLAIAIFIQGYSQTMNDNFQSLSYDFNAMRDITQSINYQFGELRNYSDWNAGEHYNMGQNNLGNNWMSIKERFMDISYLFEN